MASKEATVAAFIASAPPGELVNVVNDIKVLAGNEQDIVRSLEPAFAQYNEEQYTVVSLPGAGSQVLLSPYNSLDQGRRYFDPVSQTSFAVDHAAQKASDSQSHSLTSAHGDLIASLYKAFQTAASEHFPTSTVGVYPTNDDAAVALVLVANKYSPQNFWNGRWRSTYIYNPASGSLSGIVNADVHYYEDGNVRMSTSKKSELKASSGGADNVVREIAKAENKFQEDLNRAFTTLAEGSFKSLRRQLPVTRQRVEWEKIGGYRLGQDIGGGRSK